MELHQLRYFIAIAESHSFSRGAAACMVAQPSLSQQIQKLEREVGRRLFDRLGRTVALTDAGRALLPRARRILSEVDGVERGVADEVDAGRGELTIGAIPTIAPFLLPGAVGRFIRSQPDAQLLVREDLTANLLEGLIRAELDLCVCALPVDDERILTEQLVAEPLLVAAARGHPLAKARGVRPAELDDEPAVVLHELHCLGEQVSSFCRQRRVSPRIVCRTTQLTTVRSLVELGLGVSIVPRMCATTDTTGGCTYTPVNDAKLQRTVVVAWHKTRGRSRLGERFINCLKEEADDLAKRPITRSVPRRPSRR
ncbi:MAG: LysR substrate-binding domain-containing protein [Planctomycetota bacterium]|nr:LysR substrate-binding domain-containing protein [Planctomycetota bacterium]